MEKSELYSWAIEGMAYRITELESKGRKAMNIREEKRYSANHECTLSIKELEKINHDCEREMKLLKENISELEWELAIDAFIR